MTYMTDVLKFFADLMVLMLVAFPPFLYLYRYTYDRIRNKWLSIIIYLIYWVGTLALSNPLPAVTVLFLIYKSRKMGMVHARAMDGYEGFDRRFRLDCSGDKWRFSLGLFIIVSLLGVPIKIFVTVLNMAVIQILQVLTNNGIALENQEIINEFMKSNMWQTVFYFMAIVIFAPVVEEFVFRFWVYDRLLKNRVGKILSTIFSSLLFTAAHFNILGAAAFFLVGVINCYLYEKKGYWAAVANHFMFNLMSAVMLIAAKALKIPI